MNALTLIIDEVNADLFADEAITLTQKVKDLLDVSNTGTEFSQQFTLPASPVNNNLFQDYWNENTELTTWNAFLKLEASIKVHSIPVFTGCVELRSVKYLDGQPSQYNVIFYGEVKNALTKFGESSLIDVDWTDYDHVVNYANILLTWDQTFVPGSGNAGDILYPMVDWHRGFVYSQMYLPNNIRHSGSGIVINDLRPFIRLKAMVVNCFKQIGYTLGGTLLSQSVFNDWYIAPMGQAGPLQNPANQLSKVHITKGPTALAATPPSFGYQKIQLSIVVADPLTLWSLVNYEYTCPFNGAMGWEWSADIVSITGGTLGGVTFCIFKNNSPVYIAPHENTPGLVSGSANFQVDAGDKVTFRYYSPYGISADNLRLEAVKVPFGLDGTTLNMSAAMPDMKVSQFIASFLKQFNAIVIPNGEGNLDIHNIDEWYATGNTLDWTEYLQTKEIDHAKVNIPRLVDMRHREGPDFSNLAFTSVNARAFGEAKFSPEVDFADSPLNVHTDFTIIPPSIMREVNDLGQILRDTDLQLMVILDQDAKPVQIDLLQAFYVGKQAINDAYYFQGAFQTNFPLMSPYKAHPTLGTTDSMAFGIEATISGDMPTATLFANWWQPYLSRLYSSYSRLVKLQVNLPVGEWLGLELNDTIAISSNYYKVQKITYNILEEVAQLELITYQDVNIIGWSSSGNLPGWSLPTGKPAEGESLLSTDITGRKLGNGRDFGGTIYTTLNDQSSYDQQTVQNLKNQMFKANERLTQITAYDDVGYTQGITGAAVQLPYLSSVIIGDGDARFTYDGVNFGVLDVFGGQFKLTASISFEQTAGKDLKFFIAVDGVATLASASVFGVSSPVQLEAIVDVNQNGLVQIFVQDLNAEVRNIDLVHVVLTMKLL